jgi:hypothetical protein
MLCKKALIDNNYFLHNLEELVSIYVLGYFPLRMFRDDVVPTTMVQLRKDLYALE